VQPDGIRPATPHDPPDAKDMCPCRSFTRAVAVIRCAAWGMIAGHCDTTTRYNNCWLLPLWTLCRASAPAAQLLCKCCQHVHALGLSDRVACCAVCVACRDPYATFLAEYKRLRTHDYSSCSLASAQGKACHGGHVSVIRKEDFNATDFRYWQLHVAAAGDTHRYRLL
jgi:hypothetical protein